MHERNQIIDTLAAADRLVLATGKELTRDVAVALLGLSSIELFDPELPRGEKYPARKEPATDDAKDAVLFKLESALEYYSQQNADESILILAGDVVSRINGEVCHQFARDGRERTQLPHLRYLKELARRYCTNPFTAEWQVAFGGAENGQVRMGELFISAEFPKLTPEMVIDAYNPLTSTGIELVELAHKLGIQFKVKFSRDDSDTLDVSAELAEQLIVAKVPSVEMIGQLFALDTQQMPEGYAGLMFALAA